MMCLIREWKCPLNPGLVVLVQQGGVLQPRLRRRFLALFRLLGAWVVW